MKRRGECQLSATNGASLVSRNIRGSWLILHDGVGLEQPEKLILGVTIGHPSDVIANGTFRPLFPDAAIIAFGQQARFSAKLLEQLTNDATAFDSHALDPRMVVDSAVQELLECGLERAHVRTGFNKRRGRIAYVGNVADALLAQPLERVLEQISYKPVDEFAHHSRLKLFRAQVA